MPIDLSTEQLTKIYNDSNGITGGKNPPISTERIFKAMQACYAMGAKEQREKDIQICNDQHYNWRFDDEPNSDSGPHACANAIRISE